MIRAEVKVDPLGVILPETEQLLPIGATDLEKTDKEFGIDLLETK